MKFAQYLDSVFTDHCVCCINS